ncbi:hypothetical protein B0H13DRAFT_2082048 [Mycena leptocephala]|nr:hypothetical protein B0H13DRAFT_2082048 [Mycena leptocephala]
MLSNETVTPRPRPPAKMRSTSSRQVVQASPPPPYASSFPFLENGRKPNYLGSPLPATLQIVASPNAEEDPEWLSEKSREELAELLLKADDLIKERETELGVASAVCKSLYESNVTIKNKHDALVARIPPTPHHSPPLSAGDVPFPGGGLHSKDNSFDANSSAHMMYPKRPRRISVSPRDISLLSDQNAELLQKLETLEAEAQTADRSGRRALKQLEKEIQLLRDELEKTQERSEQLEKTAQEGTEKIVEEMWRKKKEREAKFRAMRKNTRGGLHDGEIRDFAPPGPFGMSPSKGASSSYRNSDDDDSYDAEPAFEHPDQHSLVSQLLSKIQELEDTNTRIIQQQSETADKLHAVQRETESISKVYEYFSAEGGVEWEVVDEDGRKSPLDGTIRFRSFRRTLEAEAQNEDGFPSLLMPRKARKSVMDLFGAANNEAGPSKLAFPTTPYGTLSSASELSPLRYDLSQSQTPYNMSPILGGRPTLHSEIGSNFGDDEDPFVRSRHGSLYDLSFSVSPSPTPNNLSLRSRVSDARAASRVVTSTPASAYSNTDTGTNALQLNVEPPTPSAHVTDEAGNEPSEHEREKNLNKKTRYRRMSQTLLRRTSRWVDGRFSTGSSWASSESGSIGSESTPRPSLPQRLSSALDLVMEGFAGPGSRGHSVAATEGDASELQSPSPQSEAEEGTVVLGHNDNESAGQQRRAIAKFVLELWLWLQFGIIILVFLWAMAKRGPKSVLAEADRRAVVKRR